MQNEKIQSELDAIRTKLQSMEITLAERAQKMEFIYQAIERVEVKLEGMSKEKVEEHKGFSDRITNLETWKAVFVAKLSVYTAIAITLGTIISQLLVTWVTEKI